MADLSSLTGVMLCTRPGEGPVTQKTNANRFAAGLAPEPLGLSREIRAHFVGHDQPPVLPALLEHKKVLRSIRNRLTVNRTERDARMKRLERRMRIVRLFCAKQREAVRELLGKNSRDQNKLADAVQARRPDDIKIPSDKTDAVENVDTLIDFASQLDFEKYMADMEFRTAVAVLQDRASKIEEEQTALFESLAEKINAEFSEQEETVQSANRQEDLEDIGESASQAMPTARSRTGGRWTTAEQGEDEDAPSEVGGSRVTVESLLKDRKNLRQVHSKESLKQVINSALAPLLVTSEDAIRSKEVIPQNLPYIYRSPSI